MRRRSADPPETPPADEVITGTSYRNDTSPPLRDMEPVPYGFEGDREANENPKVPLVHKDSPDEVVQDQPVVAPNIPGTTLNFDGIVYPGVACNCAPPDTDGEVGQTQYVQIVNRGIQVFNKTTGRVRAWALSASPRSVAGFGGVCQNNGHGDPIVLYDQLANRWVISAVRRTRSRPTNASPSRRRATPPASYYRYGFHLGTSFFDYPKLCVWPDGYYMSMNVFNTAGTAFLGPQPFAFDRATMLAGLAGDVRQPGNHQRRWAPISPRTSTARPCLRRALRHFVAFPRSGACAGSSASTSTSHVPANTTFTLVGNPASAGFTQLCSGTRACVPQLGETAPNNLDGIGDRLMFRLAYRHFGRPRGPGRQPHRQLGRRGRHSLVGDQQRDRADRCRSSQQGTYQPDTTWRWMGSVAMDNAGQPRARLQRLRARPSTRRFATPDGWLTDPAGTLAQGEAHLFAARAARRAPPTVGATTAP